VEGLLLGAGAVLVLVGLGALAGAVRPRQRGDRTAATACIMVDEGNIDLYRPPGGEAGETPIVMSCRRSGGRS
jgi:hypothetical protein